MPETDCKTVPLGGMVRWRNAERCVSGTANVSSNADSAGSRRREACSVTCTVQADVCRHLPLEGADLWWSLRAADGKLLAIGRTQPDGSVLLEASLPAEHPDAVLLCAEEGLNCELHGHGIEWPLSVLDRVVNGRVPVDWLATFPAYVETDGCRLRFSASGSGGLHGFIDRRTGSAWIGGPGSPPAWWHATALCLALFYGASRQEEYGVFWTPLARLPERRNSEETLVGLAPQDGKSWTPGCYSVWIGRAQVDTPAAKPTGSQTISFGCLDPPWRLWHRPVWAEGSACWSPWLNIGASALFLLAACAIRGAEESGYDELVDVAARLWLSSVRVRSGTTPARLESLVRTLEGALSQIRPGLLRTAALTLPSDTPAEEEDTIDLQEQPEPARPDTGESSGAHGGSVLEQLFHTSGDICIRGHLCRAMQWYVPGCLFPEVVDYVSEWIRLDGRTVVLPRDVPAVYSRTVVRRLLQLRAHYVIPLEACGRSLKIPCGVIAIVNQMVQDQEAERPTEVRSEPGTGAMLAHAAEPGRGGRGSRVRHAVVVAVGNRLEGITGVPAARSVLVLEDAVRFGPAGQLWRKVRYYLTDVTTAEEANALVRFFFNAGWYDVWSADGLTVLPRTNLLGEAETLLSNVRDLLAFREEMD